VKTANKISCGRCKRVGFDLQNVRTTCRVPPCDRIHLNCANRPSRMRCVASKPAANLLSRNISSGIIFQFTVHLYMKTLQSYIKVAVMHSGGFSIVVECHGFTCLDRSHASHLVHRTDRRTPRGDVPCRANCCTALEPPQIVKYDYYPEWNVGKFAPRHWNLSRRSLNVAQWHSSPRKHA
jgi:hypothetical protein